VTEGGIRLGCTLAEFENLSPAEETWFIPGTGDFAGYGPGHATDGDIGKVQGLVIDTGSRHITHVLLQEGHLWSRKEVAIPVSAVASTSEGIQLTISKLEIQDTAPKLWRLCEGAADYRSSATAWPLRPANVTHCTTLQQDCP
jgi:hypothetical protein